MNWQQKAHALAALADLSLRCRKAGDWYVNQDVEIKNGSILEGSYGNGSTPTAAIHNHWRQLVEELPPDQYLVVRAHRDERRAVRWNGFMWAEVVESREPT